MYMHRFSRSDITYRSLHTHRFESRTARFIPYAIKTDGVVKDGRSEKTGNN